MNKVVQILLISALIPTAGMASEETLEQRKKRIMRKYLRVANELSQVDWMVPDDMEEQLVSESERFQPLDVEFERHEGAVIPPVMSRRSNRPDNEDRLEGDEVDEELSKDPYADPFALEKEDRSDEEAVQEPKRRDTQRKRDNRPTAELFSGGGIRYESRLSSRNYRTIQTYLMEPQSKKDPLGSDGRESWFERSSSDDRYPSPLQSFRTYGASPDEGLLLPLPTYRRDSEQEDRLKPGQIPFRYRKLVPVQQDPSDSRIRTTETYRRYADPLPYQQLKNREKAWDPTSDDAYVDELKYKVHK